MKKRDLHTEECHVFHAGAVNEYEAFLKANRGRITCQELAPDRVLVFCTPQAVDGGTIFIAGYFA